MRWLDTPESWDWMLDKWTRVYQAAGVEPEMHLLRFFLWTIFGLLGGIRIRHAHGLPRHTRGRPAQLGTLADDHRDIRHRSLLHAHLRHAAGEVAAEEASIWRPPRSNHHRGRRTGRQCAGRAKRISKLWHGARVVDHHGMTEIGPVSYGCPKRPDVLHVMEDSYIAEVIDPESGRPVPRGVTGELVLTNLGRLGSPLLRYRTSDMVQAAPEDACDCGTYDLALNGGILGRTDDMIVVRGVNMYPGAVDNILRAFEAVSEYRVAIQNHRSLPELSIQVEPAQAYANDSGLTHRLEAALTNAFALRIPVSLVPQGSLPRFEMKARRWVTL